MKFNEIRTRVDWQRDEFRSGRSINIHKPDFKLFKPAGVMNLRAAEV